VANGRRWTREELLLVLHLYERIPFGQQHQSNPQVQELAGILSRTPGSVAMKLNNFTALDPDEAQRGVRGLVGASNLDRQVWNEFHDGTRTVEESEALWESRVEGRSTETFADWEPMVREGPTEAVAIQRVRLGQQYFRRVVLANFGYRCALTGIGHRDLLTASHISPWAADTTNRVSAANGLCLNKLHDAAFDRKLIAFDDEFRLIVGERLRRMLGSGHLAETLLTYEGQALARPVRREISKELLRAHRASFEAAEA
jgi:predicted restriction endonuclease